jgi:hypothetical protein
MDGSANNRAFVRLHFPGKEPMDENFTTTNIYDPSKSMVFLMDPSVRNIYSYIIVKS